MSERINCDFSRLVEFHSNMDIFEFLSSDVKDGIDMLTKLDIVIKTLNRLPLSQDDAYDIVSYMIEHYELGSRILKDW